MEIKYIFLLSGFLFFLAACSQSETESESQQASHSHEQEHGHEHHEAHSANEYMYQSSTEELIAKFESAERDAYQQPEKVLDYLGDLEGKTIMDIGAGSGYFSVRLAERGAKVIAADVDEEFQTFIKQRIAENELQNIETRKIPYDSPDLAEQEVDIAFVVNTYHHIENRADYFSKVKAGTRENGELIIIDFFKKDTPVGPPANHKIAMDVVVAELKEAGYSSFDNNVDLLPYQYIIRAK